ncbi:MAG: hypothetical protein OEZ21_07095 [Candidatus Bathyarchaeota archaeon]|nr:hypothetical protein [Candidatus Bathyarchaeota archaeon]MDH5746702.1 hypothetical protein [Candidatus Bathyarchaeota archaeon]
MKVVMGKTKHLWVVVGEESERYDQVIIDREHGDIRVVIGNNVIKIRKRQGKFQDILVNDIFVHKEVDSRKL